MINRTAIQQWSNHAPWIDNAQIEQDLIICRALVSIFSDEFLASQLAFRGGTALHKLYLSPQPRFTNDMQSLLRPGISFNASDAYPLIYETFIDKMEGKRD